MEENKNQIDEANAKSSVDCQVISFLAEYENKKISLGDLWVKLHCLEEESGQRIETQLERYGDTITLWLLHTFETTMRPLW